MVKINGLVDSWPNNADGSIDEAVLALLGNVGWIVTLCRSLEIDVHRVAAWAVSSRPRSEFISQFSDVEWEPS